MIWTIVGLTLPLYGVFHQNPVNTIHVYYQLYIWILDRIDRLTYPSYQSSSEQEAEGKYTLDKECELLYFAKNP
jgi:hypothetical membrane protein